MYDLFFFKKKHIDSMKIKAIIITITTLFSFNIQAQNTSLMGLCSEGGQFGSGTIFLTDHNGENLEVKQSFLKYEGAHPYQTKLCLADNGLLYGLTRGGGDFIDLKGGVIFEYNPNDGNYKLLKELPLKGSLGKRPFGALIQASNKKLYGMTLEGGTYGKGVLFAYDISNDQYSKLIDFDSLNGAKPFGSLYEASNGLLYGLCSEGGINNLGVLFKFNPNNNQLTKVYDFNNNNIGHTPMGSLIQSSNGYIYGFSSKSGTNNTGTIFKLDPINDSITLSWSFNGPPTGGMNPKGSLMEASNGNFYAYTYEGGLGNTGVFFEFNPMNDSVIIKENQLGIYYGKYPSSQFTELNGRLYGTIPNEGSGLIVEYDLANDTLKIAHQSQFSDYKTLIGELTLADNGNFYGLESNYGQHSSGSLYEFNPINNDYSLKFSFQESENGNTPVGMVTQTSKGKIFGTTKFGGVKNNGIIFEYSNYLDSIQSVYNFNLHSNNNGFIPSGYLLEYENDQIYGTNTYGGNASFTSRGDGVIYKFTPSTGQITTKVIFDEESIGKHPRGLLLKASNNKIYGVTSDGGANSQGVLFEYDVQNDTLIKKVDFLDSISGAHPFGSLIQASNGKLYGMTSEGGVHNVGIIFEYDYQSETLTKLFDFGGLTMGKNPKGSLLEASNGKLYGLTRNGGVDDKGTLFEYLISSNTFNTLFNFSDTYGTYPEGDLIQATNGNIYGFCKEGGAHNQGTLFELDLTTNQFSIKHEFNNQSGAKPIGRLTEVNVSVGLNEKKSNNSIMIFPNPTAGQLKVKLNSNEKADVYIYDTEGRLINQHHFLAGEMPIFDLNGNKGVYYIKIKSNSRVFFKKVIKH